MEGYALGNNNRLKRRRSVCERIRNHVCELSLIGCNIVYRNIHLRPAGRNGRACAVCNRTRGVIFYLICNLALFHVARAVVKREAARSVGKLRHFYADSICRGERRGKNNLFYRGGFMDCRAHVRNEVGNVGGAGHTRGQSCKASQVDHTVLIIG